MLAHGCVIGRGARSPLVDGCAAQPVALGQDCDLFLRRLEFGPNSRRRSGGGGKGSACTARGKPSEGEP